MVDVVDAISTSLELVKRLRELNKKVGDADFKMLLADLTSELGDAKLEAANLKIEIASLREDVQRLKVASEQRAGTEPDLKEGTYVFGDESRRYCTACYDLKNRKVLLTEKSGHFLIFGKWQCPSCDKTFGPTKF